MTSPVRVLIADDHGVVAEGLSYLIQAQPDMEVTGEAGDGESACELVPNLRPDVVVMDVSMPGMSGARATEQLRQTCPQVKVLALTVHEDKGYLRLLLEAGASGYVLKRAAAEELIHAIRTVAAGGVCFGMGHLNDGGAALIQLLEHVHDFLGLVRVEVAGGLVGQDDFGIGDDRAGDGDQLLLAS